MFLDSKREDKMFIKLLEIIGTNQEPGDSTPLMPKMLVLFSLFRAGRHQYTKTTKSQAL
jgi:hypothetical protein